MADITGGLQDDTLSGTDEADTISGLAGNDLIYFGIGADTIDGGDGDDRFVANAVRQSSGGSAPTAGRLDGGAGFDTVDLSGILPAYYAASGGIPTIYVGSQPYAIAGIERLILSQANDFVTAIPAGMEIHGGGGDDYFSISGDVRAYGDEGNDRFFLSGSFDGPAISGGIVDGGSGVDTLQTNIAFTVDLEGLSSSGNTTYTIRNFDRVQVTTGGSYSSTVLGDAGDNIFEMNPLFATDDNGRAGVVFDGRGGNDTLTGSNGDDVLIGGDGNDVIDGRDGNDRIYGGAGDDRIIASAGADEIDGGSGVDTLAYLTLARAQAIDLSGGGGTIGDSQVSNVENFTFRDGTITFDENSFAAQVYRLYDTAFGREPDYYGGQGWIDALSRGGSLVTIASLFVGSPEFQARTAGLSNAQLVDYVYDFALHRAPDPGGRANWISYLDSGHSLGEMIVGFSESAEHKANTASAVQEGLWDGNRAFETVEFMYDAVFGRLPDQGGLLGWASAVESGATIRDLAGIFIRSDEYRGNTAGMSNAQLVDYTYQTALDRSPDPGGRANWIAHLDHGGSVADLIAGFASSTELMNSNIHNLDYGAVFI